MRYAVILAGGAGTRLWPASRQSRPKQLLPLGREDTPLIVSAVALGRNIADHVMIVTAESQLAATRAAVPGVEMIAEPVGRNTAAAIGLAGALIAGRDPDALIAVLPADHHVRDLEGMSAALDTCLTAAAEMDAIALVGVPPTRPETGFGYLEMATTPTHRGWAVLRFIEKPDQVTAETFVASGRHLWNAGIFCLTVRRLNTELAAHLPSTACAVRQIASGEALDPRALYEELSSISFDHAVMERTSHIVAVPVAVGWNDVGSWAALSEVRGANEDGNTLAGRALVIDGQNNVVMSDDDTLIATIGVSGLVVIKSGNAVLVVRKDQAQRVREIVGKLDAEGLGRYL